MYVIDQQLIKICIRETESSVLHNI